MVGQGCGSRRHRRADAIDSWAGGSRNESPAGIRELADAAPADLAADWKSPPDAISDQP